MFFDVHDITDSKWSNDATGGKEEIVTCSTRSAGETDGVDGQDAEIWGQYGFASRPAAPDGESRCQSLVFDIGGRLAVLATRDLRGADNHGALNPGDVAVWSVGKNVMYCKADGSCGIRQIGKEADAFLAIESDGAVLAGNQWGMFQIDQSGPALMHADGMASIGLTAGGVVSIIGTQVAIGAGVIALGVGATVPLAIQPGSPVATIPPASPAFMPSFPVTRILVPPA